MPFSYRPGENDIRCVDLEGIMNLITAAKTSNASHFIYTSFSGNLDLDFPLRNAKRKVEQTLKESGLVYTILRPSMFMEVWLSPAVGFDAAKAQAQIYGAGDQPISWISLQDVAQFAVACLDNPAARSATLELGGSEALSPHQVIKTFEQASGRTFEVTHVPPEALQAQLKGATDPMQQSFVGLMLCYAKGDPIDMRAALKSFPMNLVSVQDYARRALGN
jgi:NADH dehydrogenase